MNGLRTALLTCAACVIANAETLAIANVTAINPRAGSVQHNVTVVVDGGKIQLIQPASTKLPKGAKVIDGANKFLIPGLEDAHVHLTKAGVLSLPLFVANGVTGVRDMGSDFNDIQRWRRAIAEGKITGPRIKTSGQILEAQSNVDRIRREGGVEPVDRIRIGIANPAEAREAVKRLATLGVDHIKMRTTPDLETFRAVADEVRMHHLPFAAHALATPEELIAARLNSVEHLLSFPPLNKLSRDQRSKLFQNMAANDVYMSNTMANFVPLMSTPYSKAKEFLSDATGRIDARRKYVCGYLISDWREQLEELKDDPFAGLRKDMPNVYRDLREMLQAGVKFLAGTDVAVLFMYPGFSMHDELAALVKDAGFTPMQALRVATSGLAEWYGETDKHGALEIGQRGDLVLLDADPVADIRNTKRIAGVSLQGQWMARTDLDRLLLEVEQSAQSDCGMQNIGHN